MGRNFTDFTSLLMSNLSTLQDLEILEHRTLQDVVKIITPGIDEEPMHHLT